MNPIMDTDWEAPENAYELMRSLGAEPTEGVIVALFPDSVTEVSLGGEKHPYDAGVDCWAVLGRLGAWGTRLLDVVTEPAVDVKWWKVRDFAKEHGYDLVPERWNGPICDIPERYFAPGTVLGVRLFGSGPWFWPLEKPLIEAHKDADLPARNLDVLKGFST